MSKPKKHWKDYSPRRRRMLIALGAVEVTLALTAWADLLRRPAELVNGRKRVWAAVIGINTIGPLAYFRWGRRKPATQTT